MQDLRLVGVHEDGRRLLLAAPDGSQYLLPINEALRAAARQDRPRLGQLQIEASGGIRPREIQAMVRSGMSVAEVAERTGWTPERVTTYAGPVLDERGYIASLGRQSRLATQLSGPSLEDRVRERMTRRDVDPQQTDWDAWRADPTTWTVAMTFVAGGRQRQARWRFSLTNRALSPLDDEARWLSQDDDTTAVLTGDVLVPTTTQVYDLQAQGGITPRRPSQQDPVDLVAAMRERSRRRRNPSPADVPGVERVPEDAVPLTDFGYDPSVHGDPPAAHPRLNAETEPIMTRPGETHREERAPEPVGERADEPGAALDEQASDRPSAPVAGAVIHDLASRAREPRDEGRDAAGQSSTDPVDGTAPQDRSADPGAAGVSRPSPTPARADAGSTGDRPGPRHAAPSGTRSTTPGARSDQSAPTADTGASRRSRRTSVPSWDDIVFGTRSTRVTDR